jgi:hypothetical protein
MGTRSQKRLPTDLAQARGRFEAWRQRRTGNDRIPPALWTLAVRLGKLHGLSRTATVLGLDYYSLKKRAEAADEPSPSNTPAFVELPAPVVVGKQCLFELEDGAGASMRVQLLGYDAGEIAVLSRSLWSAR